MPWPVVRPGPIAGLPVPRALHLASHGTGSVWHGRLLLRASLSLGQGRPIREALEEAEVLPADLLAEIHRGEEEGNLPARLPLLAEGLAQQARIGLDRASPVVVRLLTEGVLLLLTGVAAMTWQFQQWLP